MDQNRIPIDLEVVEGGAIVIELEVLEALSPGEDGAYVIDVELLADTDV